MAMVGVSGSNLQVYLQPELVSLVWGSAATCCWVWNSFDEVLLWLCYDDST